MPPGALLHTIGNTEDAAWFLQSGRWAFEDIRAALARQGQPLETLGAVLDFGCGVGRVIRHWSDRADSGLQIVGTDCNPALIRWCRSRLGFATFLENRLDGRIDAPDQSFGLVYALSVFTHLSVVRQRHWMDELFRVLRPGGYAWITLHGAVYRDGLNPDQQARFDRGELIVVGERLEGSNHCAAFHPPAYVTAHLARNWELIEFHPSGARGNPHQDAYLLRRPAQRLTCEVG